MLEYRISWEMPPLLLVAAIEANYGDTVWRYKPWDELVADAWWRPVERLVRCECDSLVCTSVEQQAAALRRWAERCEQPIRNVRLEQREIEVGDWIELDP